MAEFIRSIKITLEVDTTKRSMTSTRELDSLNEIKNVLNVLDSMIEDVSI